MDKVWDLGILMPRCKFVLGCTLAAIFAFAQEYRATITGRVTDPSGAPDDPPAATDEPASAADNSPEAPDGRRSTGPDEQDQPADR